MRLLVSGTTRTVGSLVGRWPERLGLLVTPRNVMSSLRAAGIPWAADNDCFGGLDEDAYRRMLARVAGEPGCLFVAVPDAVGNSHLTHLMFGEWWQAVHDTGQPLAYVGQDGAEYVDLPWGEFQAWFIGGTTRWKLSAASAELAQEARRRGKYVHMGRVNSRRRMESAASFGCHSIDGSSASRYGDVKIHRYCAWLEQIVRQGSLFAGGAT